MAAADQHDLLVDAVAEAHAERCPLRITGSGSKAFLTEPARFDDQTLGRLLSVAEHRGVVSYRPEELVVTARAGTTLKELDQVLIREGQMLPFEPPRFAGSGTLGGAVASGMSGPGRPWYGALRDALLGVEMINGLAEHLRFGGQVMKNVAGYDVSRLQAGAFGTLGVLLSASVKVLPRPAAELTCVLEMAADTALEKLRSWALMPLPITANCHVGNRLSVRLSGAEAAVLWAAREIGGEQTDGKPFWDHLRDHEMGFFNGNEGTLWRMSVPPHAPLLDEPTLLEWSGALRWVHSESAIDKWARKHGGYALPFNGDYVSQSFRQSDVELHKRIKHAFDPADIFNPFGAADAN